MKEEKAMCEVCGKTGKDASKCTFERCCCCWYGIPCVNGESKRQHDKMNNTRTDSERYRENKGGF